MAKELRGVAANTRKLLTAGKATDPFVETDDQIVDRVLHDLTARGKGEILVLNDEAHHCYQDKPLAASERADAEAKERNEGARVWFRGLKAVQSRVGVKAIYDLSATPYYLGGSGYSAGHIFPWAVSDFSLMDAIESGSSCARTRRCRSSATTGLAARRWSPASVAASPWRWSAAEPEPSALSAAVSRSPMAASVAARRW